MANKPYKKLRFSLTGDTYSPVDEQARQNIGDLSQLDTTHKDNLVEAINEAAQTGSGSGVPSGGTKGQVLTKMSSTDGDAEWDFATVVLTATGNDDSNLSVSWTTNYSALDLFSYQEMSVARVNYGYMLRCTDAKLLGNGNVVFNFSGIVDIDDGEATVATLVVTAANASAHSGVGVYSESVLGISAEAIQDAVDTYLNEYPTVTGTFTNEAKRALLRLLEKVAYVDGNGREYVTDLYNALFSSALTHITAAFNQGSAVIYDIDSLDSLKQYLVVTAYYANATQDVLADEDYTLSGTLTAGTSVITVLYDDKTTTFNVVVTSLTPIYELAEATNVANFDTEIKLFDTPTDFTIFCDATFNNYGWSGSKSVFGHAGFRLGYGNIDDYFYGVVDATSATRYTAITLNPAGTTSHYRGSSMIGRSNTSQRRRIAVRYRISDRKLEAFLAGDSSRMPPVTKSWFNARADVSYPNETIKLNLSSSGSTVHEFKIFNSLLTDDAITNFLNGGD